MLKNKCFFSWLLKTPKPSIAIFVFYKELAISFNAGKQTKWYILISQEYLTGSRKKGEINAAKLGNRYLVLIGKKNKILPHFTFWAYSKKSLLALLLKKISNNDALFEEAICKDCSLTLYSSIQKFKKMWIFPWYV